MEPQPTTVQRPIQLRIADDLRMRIERGELAPGDPLPTLHELSRRWSCAVASARAAIVLLKQQGLVSGGRGKALIVRVPPRRVIRSSERHQIEKDLVLQADDERRSFGVAESDMGVPLAQLSFDARYEVTNADTDLAALFSIEPGTDLLRRIYETSDPVSGDRQSWSISYIPCELLEQNPELLDASKEPWPGGTQHQLHTVGVEIARIIDEVTASMPSTATMQLWALDSGVPMLNVRRLSIDITDRIVEVSDAEFPADRTELKFVTPLAKW